MLLPEGKFRGLYKPPGRVRLNPAKLPAPVLGAWDFSSNYLPDISSQIGGRAAILGGTPLFLPATVGGYINYNGTITPAAHQVGLKLVNAVCSIVIVTMLGVNVVGLGGYGEVQAALTTTSGAGGGPDGIQWAIGNGYAGGAANKVYISCQSSGSGVGTTTLWVGGVKQSTANGSDVTLTVGQFYAMGVTFTNTGSGPSNSGITFGAYNDLQNGMTGLSGNAFCIVFPGILPDKIMEDLTFDPFSMCLFPEDDLFSIVTGSILVTTSSKPFFVSWQ